MLWSIEFVVECSEDRAEIIHDLLLAQFQAIATAAEQVDGGGMFRVDEEAGDGKAAVDP